MTRHVIALCGGVGGAKLAFGLSRLLGPDDLTIIVNTGDDFEHLGLHVSPDIDTVVYTLANLSDRARGWGLAGETWGFMESLGKLGGETWFNLGDRDLAMHVERSHRLKSGQGLSAVTRDLARTLGVAHPIVPMSDEPLRTIVVTPEGELSFQHYFVKEQCRPVATAIRFEGSARPSRGLDTALARQDVAAVVVCPSNPYLSIDPIFAVEGVRERLRALAAPVVVISPIVAGRALKGPAAKLMSELGHQPGVAAVADHYAGLADGIVIDEADATEAPRLRGQGLEVLATGAVMTSDEDRIRLARESLDFAAALRRRS